MPGTKLIAGIINNIPLCRTYRSVGDESFMKSFETATLAYEDWTHEVHLLYHIFMLYIIIGSFAYGMELYTRIWKRDCYSIDKVSILQ